MIIYTYKFVLLGRVSIYIYIVDYISWKGYFDNKWITKRSLESNADFESTCCKNILSNLYSLLGMLQIIRLKWQLQLNKFRATSCTRPVVVPADTGAGPVTRQSWTILQPHIKGYNQ